MYGLIKSYEKQKVKKIVNELKKEKFAEAIKDTIVGAIREDSNL